jgi:trehalose-phosphatase
MIPGAAETTLAGAIGARLDGAPLVLLLDIDGTLAPIAPRPEDARIPDGTADVLRHLVALPDTVVALVTGRSASDARRMAIDGVWIIGNHGLEMLAPGGELTSSAEGAQYEGAVAAAARELSPLTREFTGVLLEDKRWGLSVHYRLATREILPLLEQRVRGAAEAAGLRVTEGKKIFEVRPPVRVDKGTAALDFLRRVQASGDTASVLFAGDDRTDEDAFVALRARGARAVTVRVRSREEAGVATAAEMIVTTPDEVLSLLRWLADRRQPPRD